MFIFKYFKYFCVVVGNFNSEGKIRNISGKFQMESY